ncbi:MAG: ATP-dependent DNA helicase RecQ [Ferruginibacter sp.]
MTDKHFILKQYWGYDSFRPIQEEIIDHVLLKKDCLALLPTGGGKSICFQLPAMLMEGICLVISPLIALMKDQVNNLQKKGIQALAIHAGMSFFEVKKTLQNAAFGNYKFLYVSPERLETNLFLEFLPAIKPCLIAVDEAHCISQWGYDFRPPYLRIANFRKELPGVPVIALTASATQNVQTDICEKLEFKPIYNIFRQSFERANLSYSAFSPESKENKLLEIIKNVPGSSIVYCKSRKHTQQVSDLLKLHKIESDFYHAGMHNEMRSQKQQDWLDNKIKCMACTNAFGMGIDKPNVRVVVHFDAPDCLENYYQEAGRAGRDGKRAYAVLLFDKDELTSSSKLLNIRYPDAAEIKKTYTHLMNYLQIPAGSGEGQGYDIDLAEFSQRFKLNILTATYGIQALASEELISYNEIMFRPSLAAFTVTKDDLQEFENRHPGFEPLIKGLLRSYEGIFDFPSTIYETLLAKFIKQPINKIKEDLRHLHNYKIIEYKSASEKPQVFFLKNRMYNDDFKINNKLIAERKAVASKRLAMMHSYAEENNKCRSCFISHYFGDNESRDCGICDNCINSKRKKITAKIFETVTAEIFTFLGNEEKLYSFVLERMKKFNADIVKQIITYLVEEGKLLYTSDGFIKIQA